MLKYISPFMVLATLLLGCKADRNFSIQDKSIVLKPNERFQIALSEDHAAGENWVLSQDFDVEKLDYIESKFGKENGKGQVRFYFESISPAEVQLHFKLIRFKDSVDVHHVNIRIQ